MNDLLLPDVNLCALRADPPPPPPRRSRRRAWLIGVAAATSLTLVGAAAWYGRAVTADPQLSIPAPANVFLAGAPGDTTGIHPVENMLGTEVDVDFVAGRRFSAFFGLYNGGGRDVTIEAPPPEGFYYWRFDGLAVASGDDGAMVGPMADYRPFRPFTIRAGATRNIRLDFRLADCDPAGLQEGFSTLRGLTVRYTVLGRTRSVQAPFEKLVLAVHSSGICDHPFLDH